MSSCPATSTILVLLAMLAIAVTNAITMTDRLKQSPCKLSDKQIEVYDSCVRMIYGNRQFTFEELGSDMHLRRIIPCAWSKFGVFGAHGFDMEAMRAMIQEMPVGDELKYRLIEMSEKCAKEDGTYNIMTCMGNEKKEICELDRSNA